MRPAEAIGRAIDRFYIGPVAAVVPRQTFRYAACGGLTYGLFDPACYFLVYNYIIAHRFVGLGFAVLSKSLHMVIPVRARNYLCLVRKQNM